MSDEPSAGHRPGDDEEPQAATRELPWRRLDPRMLLVQPLRELIRLLPVLLVAVIAGSVGGQQWWTYVLAGLGVTVGLLRWLTTGYRFTPTHLQVRSGLLNRRLRSIPRDRIRSVDVDATALHRMVGLAVITVGTGASTGRAGLQLDGVELREVPELRAELLAHARGDGSPGEGTGTAAEPGMNLSGWRPSWARYAPFTMTGVASLVAATLFVMHLQLFDGGVLTRLPVVRTALDDIAVLPLSQVVAAGVVILVVAASVIALVRYALAYGGFALHRLNADTLHVSHGLLRIRQMTLDRRRLRGVQLNEPLSLRAVHAAAAQAIMTGLGPQRGGVVIIGPPGPRHDARQVAAAVLGTAEPVECALQRHGSSAERRRYTRAATGVGVLAVIVLLAQAIGWVGPAVWWAFAAIVPIAALLAEDRRRGLGHALRPGVLVSRYGSLLRRRTVLETDGVIGWVIRRSLFQRRAHLATLIATSAAGRHRYAIPDLPIDEAWRIVEAISCGFPPDIASPSRGSVR